MRHDILKTASFALVHFGVAFSVGYAVTGSATIAAGLSLLEPVVNTVAFYFHERLWARFDHRAQLADGRRAGHACLSFLRTAPQS